MKIKSKLVLIGMFVITAFSTTGCIPTNETVPPGSVGLKISLYGDGKGIENAEKVNGRVWYNPSAEQVMVFPLTVKSYPFTADSREGSPENEEVAFSVSGSTVTADMSVSYSFPEDKIIEYYKMYAISPESFTSGPLRQALRDCVNQVSKDLKLTPSGVSMDQQGLLNGSSQCLQKKFPFLLVNQVSLLNPLRLSKKIQNSIDEQFASLQAAQTAISNQRKIAAEAASAVATAKGAAQVEIEQARAKAESNRILSGSITPELIKLTQLKIEENRVKKWDGKMATTIQTPNVQLGSPAK